MFQNNNRIQWQASLATLGIGRQYYKTIGHFFPKTYEEEVSQ